MNPRICVRAMLAVVASMCGATFAAGKSYMALVGELLGSVESPRVVRDFCARQSPATVNGKARLYDEWRERNKALLDAIDEQVAHASVRLKKQGAPGGDTPANAMLATVRGMIEKSLGGMTPSQVASRL